MVSTLRAIRGLPGTILRGSEDAVHWALTKGLLPEGLFAVCLRRKTPDWWELAPAMLAHASFIHLPTPSISDPECTARIIELLGHSALSSRPAVWFCRQGIHRTGLLAAGAIYQHAHSLDDARAEYWRSDWPANIRGAGALEQLLTALAIRQPAADKWI